MWSRWLWLAMVVLLAVRGAAQAPRAAGNAPRYDDPVAATALDALVSTLLPEDSPARAEPAAWVEVSRLLPTACDQLRWLRAVIEARAAEPATQGWAPRLAQAAAERGRGLTDGGHLAECADVVSALERLAQASTAPDALLDPQALRRRLDEGSGLTDLAPFAKFALLARGAPAKLFAGSTPEDWDTPRLVLDALTRTSTLPGFTDLRRWQQRLVKAHGDWERRQKQPFAGVGEQLLVATTFQIAAANLDRALGLDSGDLQGASLPIAYSLDAAGWAAPAEQLKQANLWTWAALAATLTGSTADAQARWADVQAVNPELWPAVGEANHGWLARAENPARATEPGQLPLAADFRAAVHRERAKLEAELLKQFGVADANDEAAADRIFQTIQRAKAVELGLAGEPMSLDLAKLKALFGGDADNQVYLFVELLTLHDPGGGGGGRCCGVALYRPLYLTPSGANRATYADKYLVKILPPAAGPVAAVTAALAPPHGPPDNTVEARILIAPDGPLPPEWFAFESSALLNRTSNQTKSWVVYLPSAQALVDHWTRDATLRAWYLAAVQEGRPAPDVTADSKTLGLRNDPGRPLKSPFIDGMTVECVWFDRPQQVPGELLDFVKAKREKQLQALPVWVRK